jgi:hypothetical protein
MHTKTSDSVADAVIEADFLHVFSLWRGLGGEVPGAFSFPAFH